MTLPTVTVEIDFGGTIGVVDVSSYWDAVAGLEVTQGRPGVGQDVTPGTLSMQLDNTDGRFTPDNPVSPYWPQVAAGATVTVTAEVGANSRPLFSGTITDWQPEFPDADLSAAFVRVSAVDALGALAGKTLRHIVHERALAPDGNADYAPLHYWPLDEPPGADGADNLTGGPALFVRQAGTGGSLEFEGVEIATVPSVSGARFTRASTSSGKYLRGGGDTDASATAGEFEFAFWLQIDSVTSGILGVAQVTLNDGTTVAVVLNSGQPQAELIANGGTTVLSTPLTIAALTPGVPYMVCVDMADEFGGEWTLYLSVNADQAADGTSSDPGSWDLSSVTVDIGRAPASFDATPLTAASVAGFALVDTVGQLNYYDLWQKGTGTVQQVYGNETTATRARLFTTRSGITASLPASDDGDDVGAQDTAGVSALDALVEVYRHHGAYIQATHVGTVIDVRGKGYTRPVDPSLTIDVEADGLGAPTFSRSDFGRVSLARVRGLSGSTTYRDKALAAEIGNIEADISSPLFYATDRYYAAQDRVAQGYLTRLRPQTFTFDLHTAENDLYPDWLGASASRIGSRIRLTGLPSSHFGYTTIDGYLEGFTERVSLRGYEVTVDLSSAEPTEGVFDTQRFGWGDGVCTLSSGIDADDTSITLTWSGSELLSTDSGAYPLDLDVDGERVTISSAPAGGSSPRTVTVVRGVGGTVARAHSAGAPVEVWDVDRFAYSTTALSGS